MTGSTIQILFAMIIYMAAVIVIGIVFAGRANKSSENYFLGGRSLGPWVTAMSAEASDMSGWLLMGLPGVAYWCGLADAAWTAIGLAFGTYLNWLIVSKRLRRYSIRTDSITLPEFFSNRFREKKKVVLTISALFILVFFGLRGELLCHLRKAVLYTVRAALCHDDVRRRGVRAALYDPRRISRRERVRLHAVDRDDRGADCHCYDLHREGRRTRSCHTER